MTNQCPPDPPKKLKRKKIVTQQNGYHCPACESETVTFEQTVPAVCENCGDNNLKLKWRNIIRHDLVIETVKL